METRPSFIKHWSEVIEDDDAHYAGSDELLSIGSPVGKKTGLTRIGVHHEIVPPGRRTSWPHAEADEDELVYVLEGHATAWVDGQVHALREGDSIGFPCGTGIAHTIFNDGDAPVRLLVIGEASQPGHRIHYPLHPDRNRELGARHWSDVPPRRLGEHPGRPLRGAAPRELPRLEAERVVLRPHRMSDVSAVYTMRSHPDATRYIRLAAPVDVAVVEAWMARAMSRVAAGEVHGWSIATRADEDACIGITGLVRLDWDHRKAEIAYELTHAEWGKGYVREAVKRLVAHAFDDLGMHRLEIRTDPQNHRSNKVAEALGFTLEGRRRGDDRGADGTYGDSLVFSKLATD